MKKIKKLVLLCSISLFMSSCYVRLGELTMISTRNVDSSADYKLIEKYVTAKAKSKKGSALQTAIDNALKSIPEGEFLQNVREYVKQNGRKVKVEGDVWGIPSVEKNVTKSVSKDIVFNTGDRVTYRNTLGKIVEGTILGLNQHTAIIEFVNVLGKEVKKEIPYEELTKVSKQ